MIVEMAGRPAEHLTEAIEKHVGVLHNVEDVVVHSIKVSEPREIPTEEGKEIAKGDEMFSAFAECDIETESFARISETMFDFMPSSVEVIEPASVKLEMGEATDLLNNISGRLHRYDEIAKVLGERYKQMEGQLKMMQDVLKERDEEIVGLKSGKIKVKKKK